MKIVLFCNFFVTWGATGQVLVYTIKYWVMVDNIRQCLTISGNPWQYQELLDNIWKYLNIIKIWKLKEDRALKLPLQRYWAILDNILQYCTILHNIRQWFAISENILQYCIYQYLKLAHAKETKSCYSKLFRFIIFIILFFHMGEFEKS